MTEVIFLGAGASSGVPSISCGFGACNPNNPKNIRRRTSTLYKINGIDILIDTSPDLRAQMLDNKIYNIDAVLYTHAHFDHISGIDELREINRRTCRPLDIYAPAVVMKEIKRRYGYMIIKNDVPDFYLSRGGMITNIVKPNREFYIKGIKIIPIKLLGHNILSYGYIINDEIVHIGDFRYFADSAKKQIAKIKPKLMVMPLTVVKQHKHHVGLKEALEYVDMFSPEKVVFNHMASECDYDFVNEHTPDFVQPAYDNLKVEW